MEKKEIIKRHGVITIRPAKPSELKEAAKLYKESFSEHNIFDEPVQKVVKYLSYKHKREKKNLIKTGVIVALIKENGKSKVAGAIIPVLNTISKKHKHSRWTYNHLAVSEKYRSYGIGSKLIRYADEKIMKLISDEKFKTIKVEVSVAGDNKPAKAFLKKNGFREECAIKHHYRPNETVHVFGKLLD